MSKIVVFFITLFFFVSVTSVYAKSSYVMPYPGVMPGNKLYLLSDLLDRAKYFYTLGDIAQFKYNLAQADKYLIEAKILFEYDQYPLALQSLQNSNMYFKNSYASVQSAEESKKNISVIQKTYNEASLKHVELLTELLPKLPTQFLWQDEKKAPLLLNIKKQIDDAVDIRTLR